MVIISPLTKKSNIKLRREITTDFIIGQWRPNDINVERFFSDLDRIFLYECLDTGYKFFYPFNLGGDNQFYKDLQKFPWYYFDWKWEYDMALKQVNPGDKVLEIGCGQGDFIAKLQKDGATCMGLEFNDAALAMCEKKGLDVKNETIQKHAINNHEKYNVVCSFQVMEHIAEIGEALKASLDVLKTGGKLIISVPNHNGFIKHDEFNCFDMPPHHMGRWDERSLKNLENIFNLKLITMHFEPLQTYHYRYYYETVFGVKINTLFGSLSKIINKIFARISLYLLVHTNLPKKIKGHSILAIYKKS
jgi:2-polyprenyl-3-methyl-5-hydroxy-6-metoxy-1,4-benzoquinol methylase